MTNDPEIDRLIAEAREKVRAMSPAELAEMKRVQRRSFVIAEAAMGDDAEEAAYRAALASGDEAEIKRLDEEADARGRRTAAWYDIFFKRMDP